MDVIPQQTVYVYVSNFLRKAVHLPRHREISQTTEPPTVIHAICHKSRRASRLGTPRGMTKFIKFLKKTRRAESILKPTLPPYTTYPREIGNHNWREAKLSKMMSLHVCRKRGAQKCKYPKSTLNIEKSAYHFYRTSDRCRTVTWDASPNMTHNWKSNIGTNHAHLWSHVQKGKKLPQLTTQVFHLMTQTCKVSLQWP